MGKVVMIALLRCYCSGNGTREACFPVKWELHFLFNSNRKYKTKHQTKTLGPTWWKAQHKYIKRIKQKGGGAWSESKTNIWIFVFELLFCVWVWNYFSFPPFLLSCCWCWTLILIFRVFFLQFLLLFWYGVDGSWILFNFLKICVSKTVERDFTHVLSGRNRC